MNILLGFAPYIALIVVMRIAAIETALWAAAAVALLTVAWGRARGRSAKILEIGSVFLFAAIAAFTAAAHWPWTVMGIRLAVDCGLLAIVLFSLAIGRPFTLQYARERVPEAVWATPLFLAINRRIAWVWAAAFAALAAAHAAVVFAPGTPVAADIAVTIAALAGALRFTAWYPEAARRRAGVDD